LWSYDAYAFNGGRPHIAGVIFSSLSPSNTEGLAGEAAANDVNHAFIVSGVCSIEFPDISEYRGIMQ
jgi:hypothetical protein